jgi:hypothetical protein
MRADALLDARRFDEEFRNFWTNGSYYCILAGLGELPRPLPTLKYRPQSRAGAEAIFVEVARRQQELVSTLPSTYEYLRKLYGLDEPDSFALERTVNTADGAVAIADLPRLVL